MTSSKTSAEDQLLGESTDPRAARVAAWKDALNARPRGALFAVGVRAAAPGRPEEGAPGFSPETAAPTTSFLGDAPSGPALSTLRREPSLVEGVPRWHDDEALRLSVPGVSIIAIRWEDITSLRQMREEETDDGSTGSNEQHTPLNTSGDADSGG